MKKRRPTQADVARLARISPAVVSQVLNPKADGTIRVSPETQARVHEAVKELGYIPNPVAQTLAQGKTQMLGVFTFESIFPDQQRNFYYPFLLGVEMAAEEFGYDLVLFTSANEAGGRRLFKNNANRLQIADGAVLLGKEFDRGELKRLSDLEFPFVFVGRREIVGAQLSYVAAGYERATQELVTYLVELGHRNILYIGANDVREATLDREQGYRLGLQSLGIGHKARVNRVAHVQQDMLEQSFKEGVTAFLVEDDSLAMDLAVHAAQLHKQAPRDFSYAVLGDPLSPIATHPDWTMFKIPRQDMGKQAVEVLLNILNDPSQSLIQKTLPCTFVPGTTCGQILP